MFYLISLSVVLGISAGLLPGPFTTYAIFQTIRFGLATGIKIGLIPLLTELPIILASLFIFHKFSNSGVVVGVISFAGAAFLIYLAISIIKTRPIQFDSEQQPQVHTLSRGIFINFLNPNIYIFWLTTGGAIISKSGSLGHAALFIGIFIISLTAAMLILLTIIGKMRHIFLGKIYVNLMRLLGCALLFFAAVMLRDGFQLLR